MAKLSVKKNDNVLVIAGKDKGKQGKVLEVSPKNSRVLVDGVNIVTKHQKPRSQEDKGGLIKKTAPIDVSNVMVVCPDCNKATRVANKQVNGKNTRICKKCGASLDKAMTKVVKQEKKKEAKAETKTAKAETKTVKAETKTAKTETKAEEKVVKAPAKKATAKTPAKKAPAKTAEKKK